MNNSIKAIDKSNLTEQTKFRLMYSYVIRMSLVCGFTMNPKGVYRKFRITKINVENLPSKDEVELFWKSIWCINVAFNKHAPWINDLVFNYCKDAKQNVYSIDLKTLNTITNKINPSKAPGRDLIIGFWFKKLDY